MIIKITKGCMTMVVDRLYKISAFGDFTNINATPENMQFFFEAFKSVSLLPSVFQELQINVPSEPNANAPSPVAQQRIMLVASDNSIKISIGTNRIDYELNSRDDIKLSEEARVQINKQVVEAFSLIFDKFNKSASRLALNTESLIINLSPIEFEHFLKLYSNPLKFYNDQPLDEWSTRLMVRKEEPLGEETEQFNVITIIQKHIMQKMINGALQEHDGFGVKLDINTVAENTNLRFGVSHINEFISLSNAWWDSIIMELDGIK